MIFNSLEFAFFLPIVFILYWFGTHKNIKVQNGLLLAASYLFYGWWDWRFLSLIVFSSFIDYIIGIQLSKTAVRRDRRLLLVVSICMNLGFLGFFKYFNFFAESFADAFTLMGKSIAPTRLNIILPVGISFYTFQTLSYSIDVYKKKLEPTRDLIAFFAFVSFFPQLVAGPIERATNLLPQFYKKRIFKYDQAVDGLRQILWGLFKKVVIADNCAEIANYVFNNADHQSGSTLVLGAICFSFQIYGDFSGYSDIAIGTARLFGFDLMRNFAFPYFSRDIAEFWRRWHISLSTWFRDYLYIPLGGSKGGTWMKVRNTFIIFLVSGFWHGANWTFLAWGLLNAIYFLPLLLTKRNRNNLEIVTHRSPFPHVKDLFFIVLTFTLATFAWIFFRAESLTEAFQYISNIFTPSLFSMPPKGLGVGLQLSPVILLLVVFTIIEWLGKDSQYAIEKLGTIKARPLRWTTYATILFLIGMFMQTTETPFIYFQF